MTNKTKAQVAQIFTENNFDGTTFKESEITDSMLDAYNKGYDKLKSEYPNLEDTDVTDYIGEGDDKLVELINDIIGGKINEDRGVHASVQTLANEISDVLGISMASDIGSLDGEPLSVYNTKMTELVNKYPEFTPSAPESSNGYNEYVDILKGVVTLSKINESMIENEWSPRDARTIMSSIISTLEVPTLNYDIKLSNDAVKKFNTAMTAYVKKYPGFEFRAPENSKGFTEFQELLKQALVDSNLIDHYNRMHESKINESYLNRVYTQVFKSRKDLIPGLDEIITPYVDTDTASDEISVPDEYKAQVEAEVKEYLAGHEFQITEGAVLPVEDMTPALEPVTEHCQDDITAYLDGEVEDIDAAKDALIKKIKSGGYDPEIVTEIIKCINDYCNNPNEESYEVIQDLNAKMHGTAMYEDDGDPEDIKSAYQAEIIGGYSSPAAIKKVASQFGKSEGEITDLLKSAGADIREESEVTNETLVKSTDELEVGKTYKTPSNIDGGTFGVVYGGKTPDGKHKFNNITPGYEKEEYTMDDSGVLQKIHKTDKSSSIRESMGQPITSLDDLVVGKEYYTPSGMGGRFSVRYDGKMGDKHQFTNTQKDYKGGKISYGDTDVVQNIFQMESNENLNEGSKEDFHELATLIYQNLVDKGAGIGNASIVFIESTISKYFANKL